MNKLKKYIIIVIAIMFISLIGIFFLSEAYKGNVSYGMFSIRILD